MDNGDTSVCIVGAGPAGLVLAHILLHSNISFVVLERQQSSELRSRTKAGLIEQRTVAALRPFGLADTITERGGRNGICEFRIDGDASAIMGLRPMMVRVTTSIRNMSL